MWFDVQKALAEIEGGDTPRPIALAAQAPAAGPRVAIVASVATPPARKPETARPARRDVQNREAFPHGLSVAGTPLTWTGRVVSLDAWRNLTEWERHGPRGRMWNGLMQQWEEPEGG
jgi:hypothetical protein